LGSGVDPLIRGEENKRPRTRRVVYSDAWVLAVFFWAVVHDRPVRWACLARNWPEHQRWRGLPCDGTMSQRLRTLPVLQLLAAVLERLAALADDPHVLALLRAVDGKPLPVGGHSKDRDADWGKSAGGGWEKGYKMFDVWPAGGVVPDAWALGPMNLPEPHVARTELLPTLETRGCGGYLAGDALYDSNPLHERCAAAGLQLVAPRKKPGTGLGHHAHHPSRLRAIELLEDPLHARFGRGLYATRVSIERRLGNLCTFGGGLAPLPAWVRRPRRVARWVAAKLVINGLRQCKLQGLTP
jgi:Transposase DDE domain